MRTTSTIIAPYETEKSVRLATRDQYTFLVAPGATKPAVASAFFHLYGVKPLRVTTMRTNEKYRSQSGARKKPSLKKAIITLKQGTKIDLSTFTAA